MAPHSSTLAWKIPWTEEPGRLQSMGSLKVRHDWVTLLSLFTFMHWRRKWQPTPVFLPGESQGWRSLAGCCLWVAQSQTRLKRLSSSSSKALKILNRGQANQENRMVFGNFPETSAWRVDWRESRRLRNGAEVVRWSWCLFRWEIGRRGEENHRINED